MQRESPEFPKYGNKVLLSSKQVLQIELVVIN